MDWLKRIGLLMGMLAICPIGGQSCHAGDDHKAGKHKHLRLQPFWVKAPAPGDCPAPLVVIGNRLDAIAEGIRDDGLVVLKQPDVYSQARMTKYRRDFEQVMAKNLDKFAVILSARVDRLDQASLDIQAALAAAALAKAADNGADTVVATTPTTAAPPVAPALGLPGSKPRLFRSASDVPLGSKEYNIGLEPTVVIREQQNYLDALNAIRRVNLGDDVADSAGYALYLVRMPVSIAPGEKTEEGYGAEISVTVHPEFGENFLAATFRDLVINDLIDQLAPVIFEFNRYRGDLKRKEEILKAQLKALRNQAEQQRQKFVAILRRAETKKAITNFVMGGAEVPKNFKELDATRQAQIKVRFRRLNCAHVSILEEVSKIEPKRSADLRKIISIFRKEYDELVNGCEDPRDLQEDIQKEVDQMVDVLAESDFNNPDYAPLALALLLDQIRNAHGNLLCGVGDIAQSLRQNHKELTHTHSLLNDLNAKLNQTATRLSTPSARDVRRLYPIAPGELTRYYLTANMLAIADDAWKSKALKMSRATEVRAYLRHQLSVAYDMMSTPTGPGLPPLAQGPVLTADVEPRLMALSFMERVQAAIRQRDFDTLESVLYPELVGFYLRSLPINATDENPDLRFAPDTANQLKSKVRVVDMVKCDCAEGLPPALGRREPSSASAALSALCWAVAVDAALLDEALHRQAAATLADHGLPCPDLGAVKFYRPLIRAPGVYDEYMAAREVFVDYVRNRWPIITFAIDPVVEQQNILDEYALRRDLQLALAFAFASGSINFRQMTTYRRQIEEDAETIALNQTVSAFAHGNDTFGWRLYPRYQNPPSESNLHAAVNLLAFGGPPPNYNLRHRKIEPGVRELSAVIIMPSFLRNIRVDSVGNWFRLADPDDLKVTTGRMLEEGRFVQQLRADMVKACDTAMYRPDDVRVLMSKIHQVAAMLPMQSQRVLMPFDNAANGFQLFTEGASALVPELTGFEGADRVRTGQETSFLLFGKGISIHETRVVAGGRMLDPSKEAEAEILSQEVIRVTLPKDVQPSVTVEDLPYVEVYLATPEGISNRLLIPYEKIDSKADAKKDQKFPENSRVTIIQGGTTTERTFFTDDKGKLRPYPLPTPAPDASSADTSGAKKTDPKTSASETKKAAKVVEPKGVTAPISATPTSTDAPTEVKRKVPQPKPDAKTNGGTNPTGSLETSGQRRSLIGFRQQEDEKRKARHVPILLPFRSRR